MREAETAIISEIKGEVKWQKWEAQIKSRISSGLTVKEWCRQNNVNEKTYYYHLREVRERLCEDNKQTIVPVAIHEQADADNIYIEKNSLKISLPANICRETLTALVRELC